VAARAEADSNGVFVMVGVRPGRYLLTFFHPVLDVLGIEPPTTLVTVTAPATRVSTGTPGPKRLAAALCGAAADSTGALTGILRDASNLVPSSGVVVARWPEMVMGPNGIRQRLGRIRGTVDASSGRYILCGLPTDTELGVQAERGADTTGVIPFDAPRGSIARRDLLISDGATVDARLGGRVLGEAGRPVPNAQITVVGTAGRTVSDSSGHWSIAPPPGGTRTVEVRALGFGPERQIVDIARSSDVRVDVTLTPLKTILDTVRVSAQRVFRSYGNGFERRRRSIPGHFFDEADIDRFRPTRLSDLLTRLPSVRVEETPTEMGIRMRGEGLACAPVVFLDGLRLPAMDLRDLNSLVLPNDIGLVEVYTKELAPPEFTTLDDCGVIVVWTRRRTTPPRPNR
jgi:hypothetical protein